MEMVVIPVTTLARVMRSRPCVFCNHIIHVRNLSCGLLNYSFINRGSGHLDDPCLTDHPGQPENSCVRKNAGIVVGEVDGGGNFERLCCSRTKLIQFWTKLVSLT